jgi:hypothetical protein
VHLQKPEAPELKRRLAQWGLLGKASGYFNKFKRYIIKVKLIHNLPKFLTIIPNCKIKNIFIKP